MDRRAFMQRLGVATSLFVPTMEAFAATEPNPTEAELWNRPRELWITCPQSGESGRFTYWENGQVIDSEYFALCKIMRDLKANKSVGMHIGLLNFQYAIQQGVKHYFGAAPFILTDGYRTQKTNDGIENAARDSRHMKACANDGRYDKPTVEQLFKLACWFDAGGVGIYPRHIHVDAAEKRRWAGTYASKKAGSK